jgi:hypothetical protein
MKTCRKCGAEKETSEFHKNRLRPDGLAHWCKPCQKAATKASQEKARPGKYGITQADYDRMVVEQGGRCAICLVDDPGRTRKVWCIDHDHETGAVRGLLCGDCNTGIALLKENLANLTRAQVYLEKV